ncbi:DUF2971 domain-containing protein [Brachyspira pilosicoli]|uniref:DUF2971 domain-containing protein n=1 Tax=Brachyspira pilosicoli TaxID=52584 RepID=UPI000E162BD9|nr:DUF2971 domain-containing protein [Brachyspira pilosicoli]SUW05057.1 TPR domain-containing protein [Brachyspira pilosicoli]
MNDKENIVKEIESSIKQKKYKKALQYCNKLIELLETTIKQNPKSIRLNEHIRNLSTTYYHIAISYFHLGHYKKSISNFNKSIKLDNSSYAAYYNRGLFYGYLSKYINYDKYYKMFEKDFYKALKLNPNNEYIYITKGEFYFLFGNYKKCLNTFNKVIELNNENDLAYYYKGLCYYCLKNYDKSVKNYELSEKYCKYNHNRLSIQDKKIESLLKLNNKENEIYNLYKNIILNLYEEFYKETIFYSYDFFNISSSITENVLSLKDKIDIKENEIIDDNKNIINKAIKDDFYNKKNYYEIRNNSLYNYTRVNKDILRSILNNTLWCGNTRKFNDPVDPCIRNLRKEKQNQFYDYLLEKIKVACLTTHNDNTLMWSHYADKHQGICIEYDINNIYYKNNIILKKIDYNKKMKNFYFLESRINTLIDIIFIDENRHIEYITDLFTVKSKEWEYEDEYRILLYDEKNENPNGTLINLPIKSICFGVKTSDDDKELVYNIVNSINEKRLDYNNDIIKLYQAELDDNELFKINIKPYEHINIDK